MRRERALTVSGNSATKRDRAACCYVAQTFSVGCIVVRAERRKISHAGVLAGSCECGEQRHSGERGCGRAIR